MKRGSVSLPALARPAGGYAAQFRAEAKASLVQCDVAPLLARFEDAALFQSAHRKPLTVALHELTDAQRRRSSCSNASEGAVNPPAAAVSSEGGAVSPVILRRRGKASKPQQRLKPALLAASSSALTAPEGGRDEVQDAKKQLKLPARILFDDSRWTRSARCDYCQLAGGDLECATCDVVAHAPCFLAAFDASEHKQKTAFVAPTRFSWLCRHCQRGLQQEYDAAAAAARRQQLAQRRQVLGRAVTAYLRMAKDARLFARKKLAIVRIQAIIRGRLARWRFVKMQRNRLRPYTLEALSVFGRANGEASNTSNRPTTGAMEELRLANGFSCNPYLFVTVCDGEDDSLQHFCFETSLRKAPGIASGGELSLAWTEKLFIPGIDGNASLAFTLLSKNGPNNFFLGQAVLRLLDEGDSAWRDGATLELPLRERIDIVPKTAQKQPLRLAHAVGPNGSGMWAFSPASRRFASDDDDDFGDDDSSARLRLSVTLRPLSSVTSHCGYMGLKTTLDGFHANPRWCVLADSALRVYRHYSVTVASEVVDMARANDVRLEHGHNSIARRSENKEHHRSKAADRRRRREPNCVVIEHVSRLFVFECEHGEAARAWHKKLQAAQRRAAAATSEPNS